MQNKIDKLLFEKVSVQNNNKKVFALVFVYDFFEARKTLYSLFCQKQIKEFLFINAFGLFVNQNDLLKISNFSCVEYISSVQKASIFLNQSRKDVFIDDVHKSGIKGQGVTVAVIDTGCYPHLDFVLGKNRIVCFKDFVNHRQKPYDDNGHGTFVCGVLAGNGIVKNGKYKGIAPMADLVVLKALDKNGETKAFTILEAMQWVLNNAKTFNIKVVCMSFGSVPLEKNDPLMEGADVLWENGIVVVCAAGNDGPNQNTIKSPGSSPKVITVGSSDKILDAEIKVAPFSSRGPSFDFVKPDLLAPGVDIISTSNGFDFYEKMSGTSVSTPFVAGVCILLFCKDQTLSPNEIKFILKSSATKTSLNKNDAGSGFLNAKNIFF